jgi:hypothetical protein
MQFKQTIRMALIGISMLLSHFVMAQETQDAMVAYHAGDYELAYSIWSQDAQQGNAYSHFQLAELYRLGLGVARDPQQSEFHYLQAAEQNYVLAELGLGQLYYSDALGQSQKQKARQWLEKAAKQNNADAQWMLGGMLFNGEGGGVDTVNAYSWLSLASDQNHLQAAISQNKVKSYLTNDEIERADIITHAFQSKIHADREIEKQEQAAFSSFLKAAQQQDTQAQYRVGKMYMTGQGTRMDKVEAYAWLSLAKAEQHHAASLLLNDVLAQMTVDDVKAANSLITSYSMPKEVDISVDTPKEKPTQRVSVYRVQVASFTSLLDVDLELVTLKRKYPDIFSDYEVNITEPEMNNETIGYYRIQLGHFEQKSDAKALCQLLSQRKQACFVTNMIVKTH